jgi:chromosomal replication initiator protein
MDKLKLKRNELPKIITIDIDGVFYKTYCHWQKESNNEFINPDGLTLIKKIIDICCLYYGITYESFMKKCRKRELVKARYMAMIIIKNNTNYSLNTIGEYIGKSDHATVLHGVKKITQQLPLYADIQNDYASINEMLWQ